MVTDHSSAGFEYLLLDRPLVRIHVPELITLANIHHDYVRMLADVSESTSGGGRHHRRGRTRARRSVRPLRDRRAVAADLSTSRERRPQRCADALYEAIGLVEPNPLLAPRTLHV